MDIKSPKDIDKLAVICRKRGIAEIKVTVDSVELKFWDHIPATASRRRSKEEQQNHIPVEGAPSDEDLLLWSSGGVSPLSLKEN